MIRVQVEFEVVSETDEAYWLADCSKPYWNDMRSKCKSDHECRLCLCDDVQFIRIGKNASQPVREIIEDRIGYHCKIEQVDSQWPRKLDLSKEL